MTSGISRLYLTLSLALIGVAGCSGNKSSCSCADCTLTCCDGLLNGTETDVDCGGSACVPCEVGQSCRINDDCQSRACASGVCGVAPTCNDGIVNGNETGIDCGGACLALTPPQKCADDQPCGLAADCISGVCTGSVCAAASCQDGVQNSDEMGIDCGGAACLALTPPQKCTNGTSCLVDDDCVSGICSGLVCTTATCQDGVQNSNETGIDCGGTACLALASPQRCANGTGCLIDDDCVSTSCDLATHTCVLGLSLLAGHLGGSGDMNGTGANARFNDPTALVSDGGGNLFIADAGICAVRKLVVATGEVTTFAGSATGECGITDGSGTAARLYNLGGIVSDGTNLFVASADHTIRKIVIATAEVTTFAGTPLASGNSDGIGAAARFYFPGALASDGTNLYVADRWNHKIRKVVLTGSDAGKVTTLAPTLNAPAGLALDGAGSLMVSDSDDQVIERINLQSGVMTVLAGEIGEVGPDDGVGTAAHFNEPGGLVSDGTNLYVADSAHMVLRKIVLSTGAVTTLVGKMRTSGSADGTGTVARFDYPIGLALDGENLFVADYWNSTIRKVVIASRVVTTLAGAAPDADSTNGFGPSARFDAPWGIASDGANLYVADRNDNTIRKVVVATGQVTNFAGTADNQGSYDGTGSSAWFCQPVGLVADGAGNLYVADEGSCNIRKIVLATKVVTTLAGNTSGICMAMGNPQCGSMDGTAGTARFNAPRGLAADGAGKLYVADAGNHTIRVVLTSGANAGQVTTLAGVAGVSGTTDGTGADARFYRPDGLALAASGNLFVADTSNHTIRLVVTSGADLGKVTTFAGVPGTSGSVDGLGGAALFNRPEALAIDANGTLFIADISNHTVRQLATTGSDQGQVTTIIGRVGQQGILLGAAPAALNLPIGLAIVAGVGLAISDYNENSILLFR